MCEDFQLSAYFASEMVGNDVSSNPLYGKTNLLRLRADMSRQVIEHYHVLLKRPRMLNLVQEKCAPRFQGLIHEQALNFAEMR